MTLTDVGGHGLGLVTAIERRRLKASVCDSGLGHALRVQGLERAKADLANGDVRKARDRLQGLVGRYPDSLEVRRLLAEAYRRDRQFAEAGRWGYLVGSHASEREREAFEQHNTWTSYPRITEARLRHLLRSKDLATIADESGRALLVALPHKHPSPRGDGPFEALSRLFAAFRARRSWSGSRTTLPRRSTS